MLSKNVNIKESDRVKSAKNAGSSIHTWAWSISLFVKDQINVRLNQSP